MFIVFRTEQTLSSFFQVCVCVCVVFLIQTSRETYWSTEVMFQEFASLQHTDYTQQSPRSVSYRCSNTHNRNWSPSQFSFKSNTVYRWLTSEIAWKLVMWPQLSLSKSTSPPYAFLKNHHTVQSEISNGSSRTFSSRNWIQPKWLPHSFLLEVALQNYNYLIMWNSISLITVTIHLFLLTKQWNRQLPEWKTRV